MRNRVLTDKEAKRIRDLWIKYVSLNHHKESDLNFYSYAQISLYDEETYVTTHDGYIADERVSYDLNHAQDSLCHCILLCWKSQEVYCRNVRKEPEEYDDAQREQSTFFYQNDKEMNRYYKRLEKSIKLYQKEYKRRFRKELSDER